MKEPEDLKELFNRLDGRFDVAEPAFGHEERFISRLENRRKKKWVWIPYAAAACVVIALANFVFTPNPETKKPQNYLSADSRQADSVFNANIGYGKELLLEKKSATNKEQIDDALNQLQAMEKDYQKLKEELRIHGESQQLMHALLLNLKTQMQFLEQATRQIDKKSNHPWRDTTRISTEKIQSI